MVRVALTALIAALLAAPASAQEPVKSKPAPQSAKLYIIWPHDGQIIKGGKFWLRMGLKGMGIAPAQVAWPNAGHHHVLVDVEPPPLDEPIPNDRNHLHFGKGQTEARVELPPGRHTLQLMLGDERHVPFDPPVLSEKITITVK